MDEVDVEAVDLRLELGQRVQLGFAAAPVVLGRPIARERLNRRQLHALRPIRNELLGRQAGSGDAAPQILQALSRDVYVEGADRRGAHRLGGTRHVASPSI
jgi:hypothetical protein